MGSAVIDRSHIEVGHRLFTLQSERQEVIIRADAIGRCSYLGMVQLPLVPQSC